jgi:hypothetical protein
MTKAARWTEEEYESYTKGNAQVSELPLPKRKPLDRYKNNWEREYAGFLEKRKGCGVIKAWYYEPFSIRLAGRTHIKPDFLVVLPDGKLEIHEVKGFARPAWNAKWKIFCEQYQTVFSAFNVVKKINNFWEAQA